MNTVIWIAQILLGIIFIMAGFMKASQPKAKLAEKMDWVNDFTDQQVRGIGILEVLGGIGVILPHLTGILPILTPIAAVGLVLTMAGAAYTHFRRQENQMIIGNVVLLSLALFVTIGRFALIPFGA